LTALRADPVEDLGLALAIRALAEQTAERTRLVLELHVPALVPALAPETEHAVYRIVQEALANVASHAAAQRLRVALATGSAGLTLLVQDDGRGFDPAGLDLDRGTLRQRYGLVGMRERAELIGGELQVTSAPGAGTSVRLTV
jgi:signal transduction histidine kinase